eukprot:snap_masked-scaffold_39-processed-gene-2.60-mRNA-1 protein AED:1.00 eAED:1.00 QI:0/0/0/0/1/1/2/0/81
MQYMGSRYDRLSVIAKLQLNFITIKISNKKPTSRSRSPLRTRNTRKASDNFTRYYKSTMLFRSWNPVKIKHWLSESRKYEI